MTTRNSAETLRTCLESIRRQTSKVELLVIDNASTDSTRAVAESMADVVDDWGPERSAQRNRGARLARGRYLLFIDSDMELMPAVVDDCLAAAHTSALPAVIIPERSVGRGFWARCRVLERSFYAGDNNVEAARFYGRESFEEAGGFDEELNGAEDWDLSRRVAGGRILPRASAHIVHHEGEVNPWLAFKKRRYYAQGYWRYLAKHGRNVLGQANVISRPAYLTHWRVLVAHPILAAGLLLLKSLELLAVILGGIDLLRGRRPGSRVSRIYR